MVYKNLFYLGLKTGKLHPTLYHVMVNTLERSVFFRVGDLPLLARRPEFFANKFHLDYQRESLLCMDELIFNRTRDEYYQRLHFDTEYYKNLKHIRNIV